MRMAMRIAMVVFGVSFGLGAYGMVKETISFQYGRELLLKDYQSNRFETGDGGNDITLVIPYVFNVKGKGWFTLYSAAEDSYSDSTT